MSQGLSLVSKAGLPTKQPASDKKPVLNEEPIVNIVQTVHCPTCGSFAERHLLSGCQTSIGEYCIQTACPTCDYLLISGSLTGRVLEAYFPGQRSA